jgi:uncharacterized protein (TIGR02145 family)
MEMFFNCKLSVNYTVEKRLITKLGLSFLSLNSLTPIKKMKNIFAIIVLATVTSVHAQVVIGGATGSAATKTSVLLDFAAGQNKGIIVPYVRFLPTGSALAGGSIVLDATTPTTARMKYYNGIAWVDLSGQNADLTSILTTQPPATVVETGAQSIIGARSSLADGVLVLESTTKAMVLPTVTDVQNIPSPSPGMMVYINKPGEKRLAVYNGSKWSYWSSGIPTVITGTGKIWMDRNLGATQVANSSTDANSYGDLYQWGRLKDGHQERNSATTSTRSTSDTPANGGSYITTAAVPNDWRNPQKNALWQGVAGINNPCPSDFRLPTEAEWTLEIATWSSTDAAGAFASPLKLTRGGNRSSAGVLGLVGTNGSYQSSTVSGTSVSTLNFTATSVTNATTANRSSAHQVRCIKE